MTESQEIMTMRTDTKKSGRRSLDDLDLRYKESIVHLMQDVMLGNVSCRRAATAIMSQLPKPKLNSQQIRLMRSWRKEGKTLKELAELFDVHESTVSRQCWDITKENADENNNA